MKVALIEVSHWHFPLYIDALLAAPVEIVAVSDRDADFRDREAARFGARAYGDALDLIAAETIDFAFAFGRHVDMPAIAGALIARGIPFAIEKPAGTSASDVARLRAAAEERGLFVAVPLIQRVSPLGRLLRRLIEDEAAEFTATPWRFFAGPPGRYPPLGCAWLLDPAISGGGCMMNLATHFIDLSQWLLGDTFESVTARTSNVLHGGAVEDYAMLSMQTADGRTALVETGYCFPDHPAKREYSFSLAGRNHYVRSAENGVAVYRRGDDGAALFNLDLDTDSMYPMFVHRVLGEAATGAPPATGLRELEAAMRVIDAAYLSASLGTVARPLG